MYRAAVWSVVVLDEVGVFQEVDGGLGVGGGSRH